MRSPRSTTWRGAATLAPLLAVVAALAACGGGGGKAAPSTSGVAGTSATKGAGHQVTVTETDFKLQLSPSSLQPGPTTFTAMNNGHVAHSLEVDGPGVSDQRIPGTIAPGSSKTLTVTLKAGTYEIYCPVDGHKGLGMDLHVTVSGSGSSGMTGTTPAPATTGSSSGGGY